jgi:dipeptidyl aminopeptidase/acylaminoacyl peptidase
VENSLLFAGALRRNKIPFEMHIFRRGWHGLSLGTQEVNRDPVPPSVNAWSELCCTWVKTL